MLIALSLTAILLTFLFSFFVQNAKIEKKLDIARMCTITRGNLQTRLQTVFTAIDRGSGEACFYTKLFEKEKHSSLLVLFDNGIDPDPAFSGVIQGRIYLDSEKNLNLITWPKISGKNRPWRNEVLLSKVNDFEFEFLGTNSAPEHAVKEKRRPINANLAWRSHWPKSIDKVPSVIRLIIYEEGGKEPIRYAFLLPVSDDFVTYAVCREKKII